MFYNAELVRDLNIHPRYFGKELRDTLSERLHSEVEGTCDGRYGYILAVTSMKWTMTERGVLQVTLRRDGSGLGTASVTYQCVVCRPFKGEVMDCVVTSVNKMGFFAEAGPINVFVSNHLIPYDYTFAESGDPCYNSSSDALSIQVGADVRLRVVGVKVDPTEIFCIASIKEDFLGVLSQGVPLIS